MGINLGFINNKTKVFSFFVIVYFIFLSIITPVVFADDPSTLVNVNPANQNVTIGQNFNISIYCIPGQPIKAFEFKLSFDPSLIQANSVSKGDIFNGYTTFYNYGIINNSVGTIINVYGLIQGEGNVTNSGSLVSISFTAKSVTGVSSLNIYNLGVTNETNYVTTGLTNGIVTISLPDITHTFSNVAPSNNSAGIPVSTSLLSVNINNTIGNQFYWGISTTPNIGSSSGVNEYNGTKTCSISGLNYQTTYTWYVTCRDLISGKWTNVSYRFTTQNNVNPPGGGGGGGGGGVIPPVEVNNPPNKPFIPSGPVIIENNTLYEYSSSTYDIDGDDISYKFDWGDGNTSAWSEYLPSNATVSMSHSWESISNYEIKVMARDEQGLESSWSDSLVIIVLEKNNSENPPIVIINTSIDVSNKTIVFDASKSYDTSGEIVNYTWDFGDGEFGYGIKVVHTYNYSGIYNVTLTVVDDEGFSYNSSITLNVYGSENNEIDEKGEQTVFFNAQSLLIIFIVVILVFAIAFIVKYRNKIKNRIHIFWLLRIKK